MTIHRTEGIVLKAFKFRDYDQILSIFTPGDGLLKLIIKNALSAKRGRGALTAPFTRAEFIYSPSRGELCPCSEVSLINQHLYLRNHLPILEAATEMLQATIMTQMPNKAAPDLYKLLAVYLEKLESIQPPHLLSTSYFLKVLRHDGLLRLQDHCSVCPASSLETLFLSEGETFCSKHSPSQALQFLNSEYILLNTLAFCTTFKELTHAVCPKDFSIQVKQLFREILGR